MKFSIIIPVYNDPLLEQCLQSIAALNYPTEDYEVIVVENGTVSANTENLVNQYGYRYALEPVLGSYQARNAGLRIAQGDYLAFTDSDCVVATNWLNMIEIVLSNADVAGVMGFAAGAPSTKVAAYEQTMYEANIHSFTQTSELKRIDTRNFAMKRSVYSKIGGFTPQLAYGGDMEYGARAHQAGFCMVYEPAMQVTHYNAKKLVPLLRKRIRQNYGNMLIVELHPKKFVQAYFPQLLRYQANPINHLIYLLLGFTLFCAIPFADIVCWLLPKPIGYFYFKVMNVLAMRYGQLSFLW